jgi:hypothetical protein
MSLADTFRRTCSVGPTDSRRASHALVAYDGTNVKRVMIFMLNTRHEALYRSLVPT